MKKFSLRLLLLAASAGLFLTTAWADQVVMKNGDRITGAIVKLDGKTITVKTDKFGVVTAPWDQVASVQSDKPITVVLKNGKSLLGTVAPSQGKLEIATADTKLDVSPDDFAAIRDADEEKSYERLLHPGLFDLWSGSGSLGFAGTEGNAKTSTFTTSVNAARQTNTDKTSITFSAIKSSALVNGATSSTAQSFNAGIEHDHNVTKSLFVNVFNNYEYDKFQDLNLRVVIGGGFGYQAVKNAHSGLKLLGGADYDHASFSTPLTRRSAEAFWGDDYNLKLTGATSLVQSFRMFDNLTTTGAYRLNADLTFITKIKKWLSWNLALSDRYLSDPVAGRKPNDFIYSTGLGVSFAAAATPAH